MVMKISSSELQFFKENGYLIKKIIPIEKIRALQHLLAVMVRNSYIKNVAKIERDISEKEILTKVFIELEMRSHSYVEKLFNHIRQTTKCYELITDAQLTGAINRIMRKKYDNDLFVNSVSLRMDPPGSKNFSYGWHTDSVVNVENSNFVQCWTPLVDIDRELGGLEIVEKSHIKKVKTQYSDEILKAVKKGEKNSNPIVYRTPHSTKVITPNVKKKSLTATVGESILFSNKLMHRSGLNKTKDKVRFSLTAFYHDSNKINSGWY